MCIIKLFLLLNIGSWAREFQRRGAMGCGDRPKEGVHQHRQRRPPEFHPLPLRRRHDRRRLGWDGRYDRPGPMVHRRAQRRDTEPGGGGERRRFRRIDVPDGAGLRHRRGERRDSVVVRHRSDSLRRFVGEQRVRVRRQWIRRRIGSYESFFFVGDFSFLLLRLIINGFMVIYEGFEG